jgi:hypothetical protein
MFPAQFGEDFAGGSGAAFAHVFEALADCFVDVGSAAMSRRRW